MTAKRDLGTNPLWLVWLLSSHFKNYIAEFSEQNGLSPSQLHSLLLLEPGEPAPMNRLSCLVGCDPSYVTNIVDKLESLNLVHRQESSQDRRVKTLMLSDTGVKKRAELIQRFSEFYAQLEIAQYLPKEQITDLATLTQHTLDISRKKSSL